MEERRNSSALAMELCLSCTNPSMHELSMYALAPNQHWLFTFGFENGTQNYENQQSQPKSDQFSGSSKICPFDQVKNTPKSGKLKTEPDQRVIISGSLFNNAYKLLSIWALKILILYRSHNFQCMGKIFCGISKISFEITHKIYLP